MSNLQWITTQRLVYYLVGTREATMAVACLLEGFGVQSYFSNESRVDCLNKAPMPYDNWLIATYYWQFTI